MDSFRLDLQIKIEIEQDRTMTNSVFKQHTVESVMTGLNEVSGPISIKSRYTFWQTN